MTSGGWGCGGVGMEEGVEGRVERPGSIERGGGVGGSDPSL